MVVIRRLQSDMLSKDQIKQSHWVLYCVHNTLCVMLCDITVSFYEIPRKKYLDVR